VNKVVLVGYLAREADFIQLQDSTRGGLRLKLAVNKKYLNKDGERKADFIDVIYWTNYGEKLLPYLTKGKLIGVSGRVITRNYTREDGTKKYVTEVEAENIDFIGSKNQNAV